MKRILVLISLVILSLSACNDSPVIPEDTQLVLQAYLYAHQPVNDVTVMLSRPFSNGDSTNVPMTNATVVLIKNNTRYTLTASQASAGTYFYAGSDLEVLVGDRFRIEVNAAGMLASAETIVPESPLNVRSTQTSILFKRDTITTPFGGTRIMVTTADTLEVFWDNPSQIPHYVVLESVDSTREPLQSDSLRGPMRFRFVNEPTTLDFFRPMPFSFSYTGRHKIIVYRVNEEYFDLYKSRQQDSRTLNEPLSNVRNGLGIFTAFNSDSVFVDVRL